MFSNQNSPEFYERNILNIDNLLYQNINLIPISNWGFCDDDRAVINKCKHDHVNQALSFDEKGKFNKNAKQVFAKQMNVACNTVSEVFRLMEQRKIATKPRNINAAKSGSSKASIASLNKSSDSDKSQNKGLDVRTDSNDQHGISCVLDGGNVSSESSVLNASNDNQNALYDLFEHRRIALQMLKEKLDKFRSARRGNKSAHQYEEERKMKRRFSKLKLKQKKAITKEHTSKKKKLDVKEIVPDLQEERQHDSFNGGVVFSKFDFIVKETPKKLSKKEKRDKFCGKDYKRLLDKAERRNERIGTILEKNPEKAKRVVENINWNRAMSRVEGQKVKDDTELLRKSIQKKEKLKKSRKRRWEERKENVMGKIEQKQKNRLGNILKRKESVKKRKLQKARKKGRII